MINRHRVTIAITLLVADVAAISGAFLFAYWLRFEFQILPASDLPGDIPTLVSYLRVLVAALIILPLSLSSAALYRIRRADSRTETYFRTAGAVMFGMILVAAFVSLFFRPTQWVPVVVGTDTALMRVQEWNVSRLFLFIFSSLVMVLTVGTRMSLQAWVDHLRRSGRNIRRILIAGSGELAHSVIDRIRLHEEFGFEVIGMVTDEAEADGYRGVPLVGALSDVPGLVRDQGVHQLYIALPMSSEERILDVWRSVANEIVEVKVVPDLLQYLTLGACLEDLDGVPIVNLSRIHMEGFAAMLKRASDIVVSAACLALFAPLFPLIALAVKITSPGPILYRQQRMGLDGRAFEILKFRSMSVDAEKHTGPVWANEQDTRCTSIGALLRKLSLDELPQFWNILRGDMSLVGPRPERPYFVQEFRHRIPHYMLRHRVRAGLTGWAQVHGWRGRTSLEKRLEYDLYYVENWSLSLDLKILWMTVANGMAHEHAY